MTWHHLDVFGLVGRKERCLLFKCFFKLAQIVFSKAGTAGLALIDHLAIQRYLIGQFGLSNLIISLLSSHSTNGYPIDGCILVKMSSLMPGHHSNYDDQKRCDNAQRHFRARVHVLHSLTLNLVQCQLYNITSAKDIIISARSSQPLH